MSLPIPVVRRVRPLASLATALLLAAPAAAETQSLDASARSSVRLTFYTAGTGLVQETRSVSLPAGIRELELADVTDGIDPSTLMVERVEGRPFRILEQRVEQDPLRPQRLLELYLGREVELVTRDDSGEEHRTRATLLALEGPIFAVDGRVWIGHPGEIVLPQVPQGLRARPAVIWRLEAEGDGSRRVEFAYLTSDLAWQATYAGRLEEETLFLQGWAQLHNRSSTAFEDAAIRLVAGDVRRLSGPGPVREAKGMMMAVEAQAAPAFVEEAAFEYHVYDLERKVHLPEHASIQVPLRGEAALPVRRRLTFRGAPYSLRAPAPPVRGQRPEIELEGVNGGGPLPPGLLRVYGEEGGGVVFLGEDRLGPTPDGAEFRVRLGRAFDVEADRVQTDFRAVAGGRFDREVAFRIEVRNRKAEAADVRLEESVPGEWKLLESSMEPAATDAGSIRFDVTVPPGASTEVTYRVAIDQG